MALKVKVTGDGRGFEETLEKCKSQALDFGSQLNSKMTGNFSQAIMGVVPGLSGAIAGAFSAESIKEALAKYADLGEEIHFGAIRLNISEDSYQQVKNVMEYVKSDVGAAAGAFDKLADSLVKMKLEPATTETAILKQALAELGVTLDDIQNKSYQDIFFQIAAGMKNIDPTKEQVSALRSIFGRGGDNLLPAFKLGFDSNFAKAGMVDKEDLMFIDNYNTHAREAATVTKGWWHAVKDLGIGLGDVAIHGIPLMVAHFKNRHAAPHIPYEGHRLAEIAAAKDAEMAAARKAQAMADSEHAKLAKHFSDERKKAAEVDQETAALTEKTRLEGLTPGQRRDELQKKIDSMQGDLDYGENSALQEAGLRKKIAEANSEIARLDREKPKKDHEAHHEFMRLGNAAIGGIMLSHGGESWKKHMEETARHVASIDKKTAAPKAGPANRDYH